MRKFNKSTKFEMVHNIVDQYSSNDAKIDQINAAPGVQELINLTLNNFDPEISLRYRY